MIDLGGAYRRHRPEDEGRFTALAEDVFPAFKGRIECFGADWLGRQFASQIRGADTQEMVLMLEPGTGEVLEIPGSATDFHERELGEHAEAAVAVSFFRLWLASGGKEPRYDECIGYKRPLYLGGIDDLSNLELCDFEVYWGLAAQLVEAARNLPSGTRIVSISIS